MDMKNISFIEPVRIDKTNIVCYIENMFDNRIQKRIPMKEVQIAEEQSKATLVFQVPEYMVTLLHSYSDEGCINLDKFIEKAIKYNYKRVIPYTLGTIDNSYYDEETLPIRVTISKSLAEALSLSAFMYHSSLSAIFIEILIVVLKKLEYVFDIIYDYDLNLVVDGAGEV